MKKGLSINIGMNSLIVILILSCSCRNKIIYKENFNYPDGPLPQYLWSEGNTGMIADGHLFVDADTSGYSMSTIWVDEYIEGDFVIEYDVCIVSSKDDKNNLNCFLLYSDPEAKSLRETSEQRISGKYNYYHKLNGFIITYLANGNPDSARCRFRQNPGFQLLYEDYGYHCKQNYVYHMKIKKCDNEINFWIDDHLRFSYILVNLDSIPSSGYFAFRTWHTSVWWDNLIIRKL